ncbi:MAG: magnesium/cobalt transporter CorA [Candidatus Eisenbacteria bacterium]|nr:magnesium/cobalt transporter CorA [Candidatus Eisenbacteria bacterium]
MARLFRHRGKEAGDPPGTLVHTGAHRESPVTITVIDYDETALAERNLDSVDDASHYIGTGSVTWINVDGVHDVGIVEALGNVFGLHPLTLEDIVNTAQRAKIEEYENAIYLVLRMPHIDAETNEILSEQISFILTEDCVVSFQEQPGDVFEPVRQRLRAGSGRIRKEGADYLCYALIDAVVDHYFVLLERVSDRLEELEEEVHTDPSHETLRSVHTLRRESILLRKSVWPLRDMVSGFTRTESQLVTARTKLYLRDVHDHAIQVIDTIETMRDMVGSLIDLYMSAASNRMNEIMKVLTIVGSLFIPLTFIAGIYGMNFEHMPELSWRWGYAGVWGVMILVLLAMVVFFGRRRWL